MRRVVVLGLCVAAAAVAVLLLVGHSPEELRRAVDGTGGWAPLVFLALGAGLTVAFFPFPVTAGAAGLLFGVAGGTALATVSETLGACVSFLLARRAGTGLQVAERARPFLEAVGRRGFASVLLVRVLPGVPRHPANYAFGGLTAVGLGAFAAATLLGTAPRAFAYAALGGSLGDLGSPESVAAVVLLVVLGLVGVLLAVRARRASR